MYDTRKKAERDQLALLAGAMEKGREEGLEEGREKGLQAGGFIGRILLCQRLLGRPETLSAELQAWSL